MSERKILAQIRKADSLYNLIEDKDKIGVGLSGGKDSSLLLYLLYLMRVLGAGDIKLFSVIGSFFNFKEMQICILVAFLAGALWSLVRLVHEKTLFLRLEEAIIYFFELASGERKAYVSSGGERSKIHFATCISVGALLAMLI